MKTEVEATAKEEIVKDTDIDSFEIVYIRKFHLNKDSDFDLESNVSISNTDNKDADQMNEITRKEDFDFNNSYTSNVIENIEL